AGPCRGAGRPPPPPPAGSGTGTPSPTAPASCSTTRPSPRRLPTWCGRSRRRRCPPEGRPQSVRRGSHRCPPPARTSATLPTNTSGSRAAEDVVERDAAVLEDDRRRVGRADAELVLHLRHVHPRRARVDVGVQHELPVQPRVGLDGRAIDGHSAPLHGDEACKPFFLLDPACASVGEWLRRLTSSASN